MVKRSARVPRFSMDLGYRMFYVGQAVKSYRRVAIAFFDLDRTLLARNSGSLWIKSELGLGHITRLQALRASFWVARYQLGFASIEDALLRAIRFLAGTRESDIRARTADFYRSQVRHLFRPCGFH